MKCIEFGNQFTNNKCQKSFRVENRGKRAQTMMWSFLKRKEPAKNDTAENDENVNPANLDDGIDDTQSEQSLGGKSFASIGSTATSIMGGTSSMFNKYKSSLSVADE
eukprot:CAMPEP_0202723760 /NCGR_PEP_ID=MMETSP1385-20130828/168204_1 /ASSEMBLY_ACC=CAM_ASM_000861 /TAXON_ID=933848 /ORGANISM="Elphidium margaritaceum" /LENGTH=106 /DNA_ID=CAMNT_0049389085 /DNA_START=1 /DNA_END=318 /DNA_ORIENTATION=+